MRRTSSRPPAALKAMLRNPLANPKNSGPSTCLTSRRLRRSEGMSISSAQGSSASGEIAVWRSQMSATFFMKTKEAMTKPAAYRDDQPREDGQRQHDDKHCCVRTRHFG